MNPSPAPWRALRAALSVASLYLLLLVASAARWLQRQFGAVDVDQFLYHLQHHGSGLLSADTDLVRSALRNVLAAPVAYTALVLGLAWALRRWRRTRPAMQRLATAWQHPLGQGGALCAVGAWAALSSLAWHPADLERRDWIADLHQPPQRLVAPARKPNLLLVYAESLEATYDSPAFPEQLLAPLALPGFGGHDVSFGDFRQAAGTGWTIAGLVASQCGLPLKPLGFVGRNDLGEAAPAFLPGADCLGDILARNGWHNVFLNGGSLAFAGKGRFLWEHGYHAAFGLEDWQRLAPHAHTNAWGLDDDDLFTQALGQLRTLVAAGEPFNLTLLTVGMHPPRGFLAPSCPSVHGDMRDAVACTARLLADFLEDARREGLLRDTLVVVMGDHLGMHSELSPRLEQARHRRIYNRILNAPALAPNRDTINHFDMLPTVLTAMGFDLGGGRFALGCAALGPVDCQSLTQDPQADAKLRMRSAFYEALWGLPDRRGTTVAIHPAP